VGVLEELDHKEIQDHKENQVLQALMVQTHYGILLVNIITEQIIILAM
jgi:hypothetical protein